MQVIRNNCFETNSSSQHSIVVTNRDEHVTSEELLGDGKEKVYIGKTGGLDLWHIEYGYGRSPFQLLTTFEDKLKYAMCEFLGHMYSDNPDFDDIYEEFLSIAWEMIPGFTHFGIREKEIDAYLDKDGHPILHRDLRYKGWDGENERCRYTYTGEDGQEYEAVFDEENYLTTPDIGMIDHQSSGLLRSFLKKRGVSLKEFLTNKKYIVVIDGDEYCEWENILTSGIIGTSNIVENYRSSDEQEEEE